MKQFQSQFFIITKRVVLVVQIAEKVLDLSKYQQLFETR